MQVYQGGETTDGRWIYVGNINYDFREEELRGAFNEVRVFFLRVSLARHSPTFFLSLFFFFLSPYILSRIVH